MVAATPAASASDFPVVEAAALSAAVDEGETPASPAEPTDEASACETLAAFDVTWNDAPPDAATHDSTASPLDVASLGTPSGNEQMWAGDIAVEAHVAEERVAEDHVVSRSDTGTPAWLMDDLEPTVGLEPMGAGGIESPVDQHVSGEASGVTDTMASAPIEELALGSSGLSVDGTWTEDTVIPSADSVVAAHSALERDAQADAVASDIPVAGPWSDQLLAEYAPYIPTPALPLRAVGQEAAAAQPIEAMPAAPTEAVAATPIDTSAAAPIEAIASVPTEAIAAAPTEVTPEADVKADAVDAAGLAHSWHGVRVSATLNRLADRIRDGEIDVSSVAPDAPDAAVLASVLAALLGGGSSGRR